MIFGSGTFGRQLGFGEIKGLQQLLPICEIWPMTQKPYSVVVQKKDKPGQAVERKWHLHGAQCREGKRTSGLTPTHGSREPWESQELHQEQLQNSELLQGTSIRSRSPGTPQLAWIVPGKSPRLISLGWLPEVQKEANHRFHDSVIFPMGTDDCFCPGLVGACGRLQFIPFSHSGLSCSKSSASPRLQENKSNFGFTLRTTLYFVWFLFPLCEQFQLTGSLLSFFSAGTPWFRSLFSLIIDLWLQNIGNMMTMTEADESYEDWGVPIDHASITDSYQGLAIIIPDSSP